MITDQKIQARPSLEIFHETSYGKLALSKFGEVPEGFYIYCCAWLGDFGDVNDIMKVTAGQFRIAKSGRFKGMYSILVPGTDRSVFLTSEEVEAAR